MRRPTSTSAGAAEKPHKDVPELPAWKAFVVQFSRETDTTTRNFTGRVEHLTSGRRARFGSGPELLAALEELLDEIGAGSDEGGQ